MQSHRQFHSLTALKGLFILVIAFHNTQLIDPMFDNIPGTSFIRLFGGELGNSMFFILSGFLLSHGYHERISSHQLNFKDFLWRRLVKLYPLFFVSNLVALALELMQYGMSAFNLTKIAFTFLLQASGGLSNINPYNSPTWFLSALFVCYIVYYFVAYHAKNPTQYYCAIAVGIVWGYILYCAKLTIPFCYSSTGRGLLNFFIGCALRELYPAIPKKHGRWLRPSSLVVVAFSFFLFLRYGTEIICGDTQVAFSFVICPLILYLAYADGLCAKFLSLRPFVALGNASTSIFFWHLVVYIGYSQISQRLIPGWKMQERDYPVYLLILFICCVISTRWMKKSHK